MKRLTISFGILLLSLILVRLACEARSRGIARGQIADYCSQHGLSASPPPEPERHEIEMLRSVFDYSISAGVTHRVRLYVNIFGQCERHTLVE
jgi:hypothetical protein